MKTLIICAHCNDTHTVPSTGWMCTSCPRPCQKCRMGGYGAFCENTPCTCDCHPYNHTKEETELLRWYDDGPVTKKRIAELRYMLARTRGILMQLTDPDPLYHPDVEEIKQIIKETDGM